MRQLKIYLSSIIIANLAAFIPFESMPRFGGRFPLSDMGNGVYCAVILPTISILCATIAWSYLRRAEKKVIAPAAKT
jgi:hypothetical protein